MRKNYDEIISMFHEAEKVPLYPKEKPLKADTILDENKSVKWNREQVEISKINYQNAVKELRNKREHLYDVAREEAIKYIKEQLPKECSEDKSELVWTKAYEDAHAYGYREVFTRVDDYLDFLDSMLKS